MRYRSPLAAEMLTATVPAALAAKAVPPLASSLATRRRHRRTLRQAVAARTETINLIVPSWASHHRGGEPMGLTDSGFLAATFIVIDFETVTPPRRRPEPIEVAVLAMRAAVPPAVNWSA